MKVATDLAEPERKFNIIYHCFLLPLRRLGHRFIVKLSMVCDIFNDIPYLFFFYNLLFLHNTFIVKAKLRRKVYPCQRILKITSNYWMVAMCNHLNAGVGNGIYGLFSRLWSLIQRVWLS
jgi:hypothetical protein